MSTRGRPTPLQRTQSGEKLRPRVNRLKATRVTSGTAVLIAYNATAADAWVRTVCPAGDGRRFGRRAGESAVVQERAGETPLAAVAFNMRVVHMTGETSVTVMVEPTADV